MSARSRRVGWALLMLIASAREALAQEVAPSAGIGTQAPVVLGATPPGGEPKVLGRRFPAPLQTIPPPEAPEVSVSIVSPADSGFNRRGRSSGNGGMGNRGVRQGAGGSGSQPLQQLGYQQ